MRLVVLLLVGAVVLGGVGACSGAHESGHDNASTTATPLSNAPGLNVPELLNLTVDEVGQQIGQLRPVPTAFKDPTQLPLLQQGEPVDSTAWFQYRALNVVVTYNNQTRQVKDLFIIGNNEDELMRRCRLQLGATDYIVLPIFQEHRPTELMGLRVLALNAR
jgi:CheY-like chemotaxis protein